MYSQTYERLKNYFEAGFLNIPTSHLARFRGLDICPVTYQPVTNYNQRNYIRFYCSAETASKLQSRQKSLLIHATPVTLWSRLKSWLFKEFVKVDHQGVVLNVSDSGYSLWSSIWKFLKSKDGACDFIPEYFVSVIDNVYGREGLVLNELAEMIIETPSVYDRWRNDTMDWQYLPSLTYGH